MALTSSRLAYVDCQEIFDRALEDIKGVRVEVKDFNEANRLRMRMQYFRKLDRDENMMTYEPGHVMFGRSRYDTLTVKMKEIEDKHYVYCEKIEPPGNIEGLAGPMPEEPAVEEEPVEEPEHVMEAEPPKIEKLRRLSLD